MLNRVGRVFGAWALVVVVACVGVLAPGGSASAEGNWSDDPDHWAFTSAEWLRDQCVDIPEELAGTATAVVAPFLRKTPADPAVRTPASTVSVEPPGSAVNARQVSVWLERSKILRDLDYMRAQVTAGAPNPGSTTWGQLITEAESQLARLNTSDVGKVRLTTVGAAGRPAVDAGVESVATKSTGSAGTRIVGTGIGALSGSTTALAALTAGTAFCGTILTLGAVFGDPYGTYDGPITGMDVSAPLDCSVAGAGWAEPGDMCMVADLPSPSNRLYFGTGTIVSEDLPFPSSSSSHPVVHRDTDGSLLYNTAANSGRRETSSGSQVIVFPCEGGAEQHCGLPPHGYNGSSNALGTTVWTRYNSSMVAMQVAVPEWAESGWGRRLRAQVNCKHPDGRTSSNDVASLLFWDADDAPDWPDASCDEGYAPTYVKLSRQKLSGGSVGAGTWVTDADVLEWSIPPSVAANPTTLACFAKGATACPIVADPVTPGKVRVGGTGGVQLDENPPMLLGTTVNPVLDELDLPELEPDPADYPNPYDGAAPATGGSTGEGPDPRSGGTPGTATDADGLSCWPDGWGWLNPAEWVLRPILCAFWSDPVATEVADMWDSTFGEWATWLDTTWAEIELSPAAGPCFTIAEAEICTQPILDFEMPSAVGAVFAVVMSAYVFFEVVGAFARITGGT